MESLAPPDGAFELGLSWCLWAADLLSQVLKPSNVLLFALYGWITWISLLHHLNLCQNIGDVLIYRCTLSIFTFTPWYKNHCQAHKAKNARGSTSCSRHILEWLPTNRIRGDIGHVPQFSISSDCTNMQLS